MPLEYPSVLFVLRIRPAAWPIPLPRDPSRCRSRAAMRGPHLAQLPGTRAPRSGTLIAGEEWRGGCRGKNFGWDPIRATNRSGPGHTSPLSTRNALHQYRRRNRPQRRAFSSSRHGGPAYDRRCRPEELVSSYLYPGAAPGGWMSLVALSSCRHRPWRSRPGTIRGFLLRCFALQQFTSSSPTSDLLLACAVIPGPIAIPCRHR